VAVSTAVPARDTFQQEAFAAHLREGAALPTGADDAVATMELIDDCYRAAGFGPRPRISRAEPDPAR
jgi:predicted dehydrogenase